MTIKEIAALSDVSKTTVQRALKELNIEPHKVGNKFEIDNKQDIYKILEFITPSKAKELFGKIENIEKNDTKNDTENEKNEKNAAKTDTTATENATNETQNATNETKLIEMLEKALEDKENTIRAQQNQIDMLIKSNAMLTARLEDKQQPPQDTEPIIINEQPQTTEKQVKISWWRRLFGSGQQ